MAAVPLYERFDVHSPNAGVRWGKYLERFINAYLVAHAITNGDRKKGLLLLSAGPDLEDIYDTLKAPEDSFDEMTEKLIVVVVDILSALFRSWMIAQLTFNFLVVHVHNVSKYNVSQLLIRDSVYLTEMHP